MKAIYKRAGVDGACIELIPERGDHVDIELGGQGRPSIVIYDRPGVWRVLQAAISLALAGLPEGETETWSWDVGTEEPESKPEEIA